MRERISFRTEVVDEESMKQLNSVGVVDVGRLPTVVNKFDSIRAWAGEWCQSKPETHISTYFVRENQQSCKSCWIGN